MDKFCNYATLSLHIVRLMLHLLKFFNLVLLMVFILFHHSNETDPLIFFHLWFTKVLSQRNIKRINIWSLVNRNLKTLHVCVDLRVKTNAKCTFDFVLGYCYTAFSLVSGFDMSISLPGYEPMEVQWRKLFA